MPEEYINQATDGVVVTITPVSGSPLTVTHVTAVSMPDGEVGETQTTNNTELAAQIGTTKWHTFKPTVGDPGEASLTVKPDAAGVVALFALVGVEAEFEFTYTGKLIGTFNGFLKSTPVESDVEGDVVELECPIKVSGEFTYAEPSP